MAPVVLWLSCGALFFCGSLVRPDLGPNNLQRSLAGDEEWPIKWVKELSKIYYMGDSFQDYS